MSFAPATVVRGFIHAIAAAIPLAAAVGLVYGLGYVDRSGAVVELPVNRVAVHRFWWVTLLSCGPILIVDGVAIPALCLERRGLAVLGALAATSMFFYFFVNVRDHQDVYVGWRVGHFMFMAAAVVIGVLLERIATSIVGGAAAAAGRGSSSPSWPACRRRSSTSTTRRTSPSTARRRYWTMMLRPDELQAFDWIKNNTRPDATFQVDPDASDSETAGPICRRLPSAAWRSACRFRWCRWRSISRARKRFSTLFDESPLAAYERAVRAHVNYVFIGPPERACTSRGRRALQFDREPDAVGLQERDDFDLRSDRGPRSPSLIPTSCRTPSGASRAAAPMRAAER